MFCMEVQVTLGLINDGFRQGETQTHYVEEEDGMELRKQAQMER